MSLLLRRRALLAAAKKDKEGGGQNDGKYVYVGSVSTRNRGYTASIDYGVSYRGVVNATIYRYYSASVAFDCNGNFYFNGTSPSYSGSFIALSEEDFTTRRVLQFQNSPKTALSCSRAWCWSTDGKKCLRLYSQTYNASYVLGLDLWDNIGLTATEPTLSLNTSLTLPSIAGTSMFLNPAGPYMKFNSDNLQIGFIAANTKAEFGGNILGMSCSFTRDGGLTWTDEKNMLVDGSSSLGGFGFVSAHMSNDGKNVGFVHRYSNGVSTLYCSSDFGESFHSVDTSAIKYGLNDTYLLNFETSAKFKTWYVSTYISQSAIGTTASIWRSQDQGQSWTEVLRRQGKGTSRYGIAFHCNDAGDKLVATWISGSTNSPLLYSHDYGATWNTGGQVYYPNHNSWIFTMCRDSYNTSSQGGGSDVTSSYSMSREEVIDTLYNLISSSRADSNAIATDYAIISSSLDNGVTFETRTVTHKWTAQQDVASTHSLWTSDSQYWFDMEFYDDASDDATDDTSYLQISASRWGFNTVEESFPSSEYGSSWGNAVSASQNRAAEELTDRLLSQSNNNPIYVNVTYL